VQLNETGLRQVEAVADFLSREQVDAVYTSPLERATRTAEEISSRHSLVPEICECLIEINHGQWEGLYLHQVLEHHHQLYRTWLDEPMAVRMPEGESLVDVRERVVAGFKEIVEGHDDQTIVLVGHDATNKVLICCLIGVDSSNFWKIKQGNAGVTVVEYENGTGRLLLLNDTCHLGGPVDQTAPGAL
ncbi:MAG: histidine phosphatase family protein, partial [Terriglobia bacterium]